MSQPYSRKRALGVALMAAGLTVLVVENGALAAAAQFGQAGRDFAASVEPMPEAHSANPSAPGELAREGVTKILQALEKLLQSVPQYQMPEIDENGDIILRRKRPEPPAPPAPSPAPKQPDSLKT